MTGPSSSSSITDVEQRRRAADIHRSVIVQAPAGSGKTTLLVERFVNLLAIVNEPEEILAITFTRKAAAEMRSRVFAALESDDARAGAIQRRSRARNWRLDERPQRLRIQTIDGLAASLAQYIPLASRTGVGSELRVVEDADALYREAVDKLFRRLGSNDPLNGELAALLRLFDNDYEAARTSLSRMLGRRDQWLAAVMLALQTDRSDAPGAESSAQSRASRLITAIGAGIAALHASVIDDIKADLTAAQRAELAACAAFASRNLSRPWQWRELPDDLDAWRFIADLLTTKGGAPRKQFGHAHGFVDQSDESRSMKRRLRALIDQLTVSGAIDRVAAIPLLPSPDFDAESATALITVATGLALAVIELTALFRRERQIDFTELTFAAERALGDADAPTDLALVLDQRIRHLLIDEFQDTSDRQYRLVERLLQGWEHDDGRTLFAVGDPMQSIYRFRDADVGLFQRARREGVASVRPEPIHLTSNFRSSAALVDWCNRVFEPVFGRAEDPIMGRVAFAASVPTRASRDDDGCFSHFASSADAVDREATQLVDVVERIRREHPNESIAILVRNRSHLDRVLPALSERSVPWHGTDIRLLSEEPVVDDLLSLLKALLSDGDRLSWLALLRSPLVGLMLRDLETIASHDIATTVLDGGRDSELTASGTRRLLRVRPTLRRAVRERRQMHTRRWLENVFIDLGGADAYADPDAPFHAERFFELVENEHPWTVRLHSLEHAVMRLYAQTTPVPGTVTVMTIHRAKGLEFDHVLLPSLHRTSRADAPPIVLWRPHGHELLLGVAVDHEPATTHAWLRREDRSRERHELIRLIYVAATRARRSLHLFATLDSVDAAVVPPSNDSLLGQIWPAIADTVTLSAGPTQAIADAAPTSPRAVAPEVPLRLVLPDDYVWTPPTDHRDLPPSVSARSIATVPRNGAEHTLIERAIGDVVRHELALLSSRALPPSGTAYASTQRIGWRNQLESLSVPLSKLGAATDEVVRQVTLVLNDQKGRWVLDQHADAVNGSEFAGLDGGELKRVFIDRTFVDSAGVRWIIDWVILRPDIQEPEGVFIAAQRANHVARLRACKRLLANLGAQPVRVALYFTALPALVELGPDLDFFEDDADNRAL